MRTITITAFDKGTSAIYSDSIKIDNISSDEIKRARDEFFESVPFDRWYYQVDTFDDLTAEDEIILEELELTPIY